MGLWQSTMQYLKSFYQVEPKEELTEAKLVVSANRLAHNMRLRSMKLQLETRKKEESLL